MEPGYTYYAFISYSHLDKTFARKVQRYLEHYRLPSALCRQYPHIPKDLRPIFRDWTDLEIGQLGEKLPKALTASRYLIVICSENSARPNAEGKHWIDEEIKTFISLRPENVNRVIPIILRKKGGCEATACLPATIREKEILAADILDKGLERTLNDVVAAMVGLEPNVLWKRHEREMRRKRLLQRLSGGVAMTLAAAAGWWCWDYFGYHVSYYTDYVERNNIPEGRFELTEEQAAQRHRHYRFTTHKHRLRSVQYCNSAGTPQPHHTQWHMERPSLMEIEYHENGKANYCTHRNEQGEELLMRKFAERHIDFEKTLHRGDGPDRVSQALTIIAGLGKNLETAARQTRIKNADTDINRISVKRQEGGANAGIILRELFCNRGGVVATKDERGLGGRQYVLDELGRPVEIRYLAVVSSTVINAQVEYAETEGNVSGCRLTYAENGKISSVTYVDKAGNPVCGEEGWAKICLEFDACGNPVKESYYGPDGQACVNTEGIAQTTVRYDARGNQIEVLCLDKDGKPCPHEEGFARATFEYNTRGDLTTMTYYGVDGACCVGRDGHAQLRMKYDEAGNVTEIACFDEKGAPCLNNEGYALARRTHDGLGHMEKESYFGVDGKPCLHRNGYASCTWQYFEQGTKDKRGPREEVSYCGVDGKPCLNKTGYAACSVQEDAHGNIVEIMRYGTDGKPRLQQDGTAGMGLQYDEYGNISEWSNLGTNGELCLATDGTARMTIRYDEQGRLREIGYYGTDRQRCVCKDGFSRVTWRYDEQGNILEQAWYGVDGARCALSTGIARATWAYDSSGRVIEHSTFGSDDNLHTNTEGFARQTIAYHESGQIAEMTPFDAADKPMLTRKWDVDGKLTEETYYKDGLPLSTQRYDNGELIEESLFMNGRPFSTKQYAGTRLTQETYCGEDGKPMLSSTYDAEGRVVERREYAMGICMAHRYNASGQNIEDSFLNEEGKLLFLASEGYARRTLQWLDAEHLKEVALYDAEGNPCIGPGGYARKTWKHDARGEIIEEAFYGADGEPCTGKKEGYARATARFDERGNQLECAHYDVKGHLWFNPKEGYARMRTRFDERGNPLETILYDENDKPHAGNEGWARVKLSYDEEGRRTELAFFDAQDTPCAIINGRARITYAYDAKGNKEEERYYGADGAPCEDVKGCARKTFQYDDSGKETSSNSYDLEDKIITP